MSEERTPEDSSPGDAGEADLDQAVRAPQDGPQRPWDGHAAEFPAPVDDARTGTAERPDVTDAREESLDFDDRASRQLRLDMPRLGTARDVTGVINNYYLRQPQENRARGPVSITELVRAQRVHVTTPSDALLRQRLIEDLAIFLRGGSGTGRRDSATVILDAFTGRSRTTSMVTVLDASSGPAGLPDQLRPGRGHLIDASDEDWADNLTEAQLAAAREALGTSGFLVILVEADSSRSLPGTVVDHQIPDLAQVVVFHLAARLSEPGPVNTTGARALVDEACGANPAAASWHEEITGSATAGTAESALFAEAVLDWHGRRQIDPGASMDVAAFRDQRRYQQAASLLRRGGGTDSPLRQSYAISAAVLDGLPVSEVIEGAGKLSELLAEVEHPGEPGQREIFAQPLVRWLRHVELAAPAADRKNRTDTVVRMPSRELSRIVIEVAWRNYDAVRPPVLAWLKGMCEEHPDDRVRIRAVQALAFIARHDYAQVKGRVLGPWSASVRRIEHQAAAWLLEAMALDHPLAEKVRDLLRRWSRSGDPRKRAIAVRAYGTAVARDAPQDALRGVRFSAVDPRLGALPELALKEMYILGLTREVMAELRLWQRGFPAMRERSGRILVRLSRIQRTGEDGSRGAYDLLWRLAHAPDEVGVGIPEIAALWHMACRHPSSRSAAWQMLGRWAQSCREHMALRGTFLRLADEFEKAADNDELRSRLGVYRRRWVAYLEEE